MRKVLAFILAVATAVGAYADKPLLVGHRGSQYGVENSVESFTNGAKLGYEYLETDFKVTKDKQFVCSHDDDISRLSSDGSKLAIASSTLAELQSHPFAQTRSGVKYTGRLCSAQEYLDVCKEYNVRPLIELKWATGINNNDCSNIPLLIKFIEDNGFRDKCIILTSMKPCLEYIRKNYPDIELQFLTGEYWASHFDWCVQLGIDVDIQAGYFDKSTVKKYHDKGLKVNMWTTNTNDGYKQYGNWGCDFITTDYLDPKNLPELDAEILFPPNTVDYPAYDASVRGSYNTSLAAQSEVPASLAGRKVKKAIFKNDEWIVLSFDASGKNARIDRVDAFSGNVNGSYSTAGIDVVGDIAMTADNVLIASNVATLPFYAPSNPTEYFRLFKWDSKEGAPVEFYNANAGSMMGNWTTAVGGEHLAVSGRMDDLKVYVSSHSSSGTSVRPVGFCFEKGTMTKYAYDLVGEWGENYTMTVSPVSRDNIIINSPAMDPVEYTFVWEKAATLETTHEFSTDLINTAADGMSFHRRGNKLYAVIPSTDENGAAYTATVYDATDGFDSMIAATSSLHKGLGDSAAGYASTAMAVGADRKLYVHFFTQNHGLVSFLLETDDENETPVDLELEFTLDWILSGSTGNVPENIGGPNIQQGTAVNGLFYINDCNAKVLRVFDSNGPVGTMPGGAGFGCARDDAGNIIVRDDKLSGNTHSFIIYPAGATPQNYGTPLTLEATFAYDGQTNFINAGGDLLNGIGHIYLFSNGQNGVSIVTVSEGEVVASKAYPDLKMTGSTAGYVVPVEDNTENWLYQIRGTGIYRYNSGNSISVSTSRTSTTAPSRNSTGGAAYIKMGGNEILLHNSGANYLGGFTVRNLTTDKVITSVSPIGNVDYASGTGNASTFNWLIPEKVSDGFYYIYQYCPANGIARYTLKDKNVAVTDISADRSESEIVLSVDHNTLSVYGTDVKTLRVYNVSGVLSASADNTDSVNISALTPGLYIVTVNGSTSLKFMKK